MEAASQQIDTQAYSKHLGTLAGMRLENRTRVSGLDYAAPKAHKVLRWYLFRPTAGSKLQRCRRPMPGKTVCWNEAQGRSRRGRAEARVCRPHQKDRTTTALSGSSCFFTPQKSKVKIYRQAAKGKHRHRLCPHSGAPHKRGVLFSRYRQPGLKTLGVQPANSTWEWEAEVAGCTVGVNQGGRHDVVVCSSCRGTRNPFRRKGRAQYTTGQG